MKVGVVGRGVTGMAMIKWLHKNTNHTVIEYDPPQGIFGPIEFADVIFICVPAATLSDGSQDYSNIEPYLNYKVPTFIRSTILPDYAEKICVDDIHHVPEFLTERRAFDDFNKQDIVCTERAAEVLKEVFPSKEFIIQKTDRDCAVVKYAHNCFGAMKVNFFNHIFKMSSDYEKVRKGFLSTGYINEEHTMVPGPDGKFGYGGHCFLKDMYAFAVHSNIPSLKATVGENQSIRKYEIGENNV